MRSVVTCATVVGLRDLEYVGNWNSLITQMSIGLNKLTIPHKTQTIPILAKNKAFFTLNKNLNTEIINWIIQQTAHTLTHNNRRNKTVTTSWRSYTTIK